MSRTTKLTTACVLALLFVAPVVLAQQGETLAQVLARNSIPGDAAIRNLSSPITSYDVLNDATQFVIAYYIDDGSNQLRFPLYVSRFDKRTREWRNHALENVKVDSQA